MVAMKLQELNLPLHANNIRKLCYPYLGFTFEIKNKIRDTIIEHGIGN